MPLAFSELGMLVLDRKLKSLSMKHIVNLHETAGWMFCILFPFYENSSCDFSETAKFFRELSFKQIVLSVMYCNVVLESGEQIQKSTYNEMQLCRRCCYNKSICSLW